MNFIGANYEAIGSREVFDVLEHDSDRADAAAAFRRSRAKHKRSSSADRGAALAIADLTFQAQMITTRS
jgi:hypothetical protein